MRLHSGIVDAQEFGCAGHSVNIEVLTLGSLFVHELKDGIGRVRVLEDRAGDHEPDLGRESSIFGNHSHLF